MKIAIVTGSNRGIGLEICRQLAGVEDIRVISTSRSEDKGRQACEQLNKDGLDVDYRQLDVTDERSINQCIDSLVNEYGTIDILVNNAGVFPDKRAASSWPSVFDTSIDVMLQGMKTNVYGPLLLCQKVVPIMQKNNYGRIVNMSSGMGQLTHMNGGCPSYRLSKTSLNALTRILADELADTNILVNTMCPGWVKTEMGGPGATRELSEGADTAFYLATLPDGGPTGKFFRDRKEFAW